jgi:hypothetical protein
MYERSRLVRFGGNFETEIDKQADFYRLGGGLHRDVGMAT